MCIVLRHAIGISKFRVQTRLWFYSKSNDNLYTAVGSINRVDNEDDRDPFPNRTGIYTISKVRLETAPTETCVNMNGIDLLVSIC